MAVVFVDIEHEFEDPEVTRAERAYVDGQLGSIILTLGEGMGQTHIELFLEDLELMVTEFKNNPTHRGLCEFEKLK